MAMRQEHDPEIQPTIGAVVTPKLEPAAGTQVVEGTAMHEPVAQSAESTQRRIEAFTYMVKRRNRLHRASVVAMFGAIPLIAAFQGLVESQQGCRWLIKLFRHHLPLLVPTLLFTMYTLLFAVLSFPILILASALLSRRSERRAVEELAQSEDLRAISPLICGLRIPNVRFQRAVRGSLISLLPRLEEGDRDLLTDADLRFLYWTLKDKFRLLRNRRERDRFADLAVAALHAVGAVGDSRALPIVLRLAAGKATTGARERVRLAAQECLPRLQARVDREYLGAGLLRASDQPNTPADTLVRPVTNSPQGDPQALLRPSAHNEPHA